MTNKYRPDWVSCPGDTIEDSLEELGIDVVKFRQLMGKDLALSRMEIDGLLNGKTRITPTIAEKLSEVIGASQQFWLNRDEHYMAGTLEKLTKKIEKFAVECDGATRILHYWLTNAGIYHNCYIGRIDNAEGVTQFPIHFWIQSGEFTIDYKLQMWLGEDAPQGVFKQKDYPNFLYVGELVELDIAHGKLLEEFYGLLNTLK